jgi:hypothetical protein
MTWKEFHRYLEDFDNLVADGALKKMQYLMWRKFRYSRAPDAKVTLEKLKNGFSVSIEHEDEYHSFYGGDNSFGDFMLENFFRVKEMEEYSGLMYYDDTSSKAGLYETVEIALERGEDLKASAEVTKDKLFNCLAGTGIGVMAINSPGPSVSCVNDTKVDRAEFESKLEALSEKIQAVADKYNNIDKKENSTMKGFNFDFGPMNSNVVRMSIYGLAVKNKTGSWVAYDAKNGEIMDVDVFNFDGSKFMYRMPVAINDVATGDVIVHMSVPMFVVGKSEDGKAVYAVDPVAGERKEIMLTKSPFGFNFVTKVVNFLGNAFNADASNPFGNLGLMMMLSEDGNGVKDMLPLMLMANGGNIDMSNPLMMYALMSDNGKMGDMLPFMLMMNTNKPAVPHVCNCGQHNQ